MALRYLTIVPIPGGAPSCEGPGASAAWFPVVGLAIGALLVLVVAPVVGRAMPPLLARMFAAAPSGHGARFRAELGPAGPAVATAIAVVVAIGVLGASGVLALVIGIGLTTALGAFMMRRLGA